MPSRDWSGPFGAISTESGALSAYPYGFSSRFEGKPGSNPEELIGAAVYLAAPASDFVNGHLLFVDGGMLAAV